MTNSIRIAFTSCARIEDFPIQPQWRDIENANPDFLLLLGDQIYMDYGMSQTEPNGAPAGYPADKFRSVMAGKYEAQWAEPNFKSLLLHMRNKEKICGSRRIFGTWDDHDFGWNNAFGHDMKPDIYAITHGLFHQWMDCSTNRPNIYCHTDIGDLARLIVLDQRSHAKAARPACPDAVLLGDEQWEFLRDKLNHDKRYTLICGGLSLTHGKDNWEEYEHEYQCLHDLIGRRQGVIYLGGDIHKNKLKRPGPDRPCYEIISSGLAVNYLAQKKFDFDDCHNWSYIDLSDAGIEVTQNTSGTERREYIKYAEWWG